MSDKEIWKDIVGYEGLYQVSNMGRVKSLPRWHRRTELILKPHHFMGNYERVALADGHRDYTGHSIHRLVAIAFLPNPLNLPEVNHKDENPANNHVDNLEWCTHTYNQNYGTRTERASLAESVPVVQFSIRGDFVKEWASITEVKRIFGGKGSGIRQCCNETCRMAYGYLWRWRKDFDKIPAHIEFKYTAAKIQEKPVRQYTLSGEFIKEYPSALSAAKENGYSRGNISNVCRGNKPYMYGYIWRYKGSNLPVLPVIPTIPHHKRAVLQFSLDGQLINEFESSPDAERKTGIRKSGIFRCCKGGRKPSGGYKWAFKDIYEKKGAGCI